ncbi:hypothetical protein BC826DRAFT_477064 [Russula brevipes]|nr:hypothetical protein BC826DRAFT_477064 [Russula brevipes]
MKLFFFFFFTCQCDLRQGCSIWVRNLHTSCSEPRQPGTNNTPFQRTCTCHATPRHATLTDTRHAGPIQASEVPPSVGIHSVCQIPPPMPCHASPGRARPGHPRLPHDQNARARGGKEIQKTATVQQRKTHNAAAASSFERSAKIRRR